MSLIPYAGAENVERATRPKTKKFESSALMSLRAELITSRAKCRAAIEANETLRMRLSAALERVADLESIICRATSALSCPQQDSYAWPYAEQANKIVLAVTEHFGITPTMVFGRARGLEYTV